VRIRIDYRWILTTSVVVGVAGVGTAAIMRQGGRFDVAPEPLAELSRLNRPIAQVEPALLSRESRTSRANLSRFESEALPPLVAANRGHYGEAARFRAPAGNAGARQFAGGQSSGGHQVSRGFGGGSGGGSGSGGMMGGAGGGRTPGNAALTPSSHSSGGDNSHSSGAPAHSPSGRPTVPGKPTAPGNPNTGNASGSNPTTGTVGPPPAAEPGSSAAFPPTPGGQPPRNLFTGPPASVSATPEPASLLLIGTGIVGMLGALRRRL
jgi:hypothetical protein